MLAAIPEPEDPAPTVRVAEAADRLQPLVLQRNTTVLLPGLRGCTSRDSVQSWPSFRPAPHRTDGRITVKQRGDHQEAARKLELAGSFQALHDAYRQRETVFAAIMADRDDWEKATVQQRYLAVAADAELRRRHPGEHCPPLRSAEPELAARAADLTQADLDQMLAKARLNLSGTAPQTVTLGRVIYHPEGIVLPLSPASALPPIFEAAQAATLEVTGTPGLTSTLGLSWHPHVTMCYSTSQQPATPIIAALANEIGKNAKAALGRPQDKGKRSGTRMARNEGKAS
jgi:hypothetical protein